MKMKIIFYILGFFIQLQLVAQDLSFSKDTLNIFPNEFEHADTIWIFNNGEEDLVIDSIRAVNFYLYELETKNSDSTTFHYVRFNAPQITFIISSKDSVKLIFSDPDLCPICKSIRKANVFFTDTLMFYSSSILLPIYDIHVQGDGYVSVNSERNYLPGFELSQNYPNPFNPTTTINYQLPERGFVKLNVYNMLGEQLFELVNEYKGAGFHSVQFNDKILSTGMYLYKIQVGEYSEVKKMLLIK